MSSDIAVIESALNTGRVRAGAPTSEQIIRWSFDHLGVECPEGCDRVLLMANGIESGYAQIYGVAGTRVPPGAWASADLIQHTGGIRKVLAAGGDTNPRALLAVGHDAVGCPFAIGTGHDSSPTAVVLLDPETLEPAEMIADNYIAFVAWFLRRLP